MSQNVLCAFILETEMTALIDLVGQRFGKWTVLSRASNGKNRQARWLCRCDCERENIVAGIDLRNGHSKGCRSCQVSRRSIKHGLRRTRIYNVWTCMINRCENPNFIYYKNYGGRGIKICLEWRNSVVAFYNWATANGYKEELQIDRINNNGNYEPSNCRFVTQAMQQRNTRYTKFIAINGETKPMCEWAELAGLSEQTLWNRINANWPENRLLEPVHVRK